MWCHWSCSETFQGPPRRNPWTWGRIENMTLQHQIWVMSQPLHSWTLIWIFCSWKADGLMQGFTSNAEYNNGQRLLYGNVILAHTSKRRDEGELVFPTQFPWWFQSGCGPLRLQHEIPQCTGEPCWFSWCPLPRSGTFGAGGQHLQGTAWWCAGGMEGSDISVYVQSRAHFVPINMKTGIMTD